MARNGTGRERVCISFCRSSGSNCRSSASKDGARVGDSFCDFGCHGVVEICFGRCNFRKRFCDARNGFLDGDYGEGEVGGAIGCGGLGVLGYERFCFVAE